MVRIEQPRTGSFRPVFRPIGFWPWETIPATTLVHALDREEEHGEVTLSAKFHCQPSPDAPGSGPANAAAAATVGRRFSSFSGHCMPTHTSLPPILVPLNSFPWSFSSDSSPFERYDENKFDRRLDRVFRPPQQLLDQGKGTAVFLVSWDFR